MMTPFRQLLFNLIAGISLIPMTVWGAEDLRARLFPAAPGSKPTAFERQLSDQNFTAELASPEANPSASAIQSSRKPLTRGGAMWRSLLVPGWGESYLGYHRTARYFFWADVAIWATIIGLETYSNWREDQFMSFGKDHADAQMQGKDDGFYADIGNYMNTDEYNEAKLRNRDFESVYTDPAYFWSWDTDQNRRDYDQVRIQSRSAHNKVFFFVGAAALNRLISLIDTGKKARDLQKQTPALGLQVQPDTFDQQASISLVLTAHLDR